MQAARAFGKMVVDIVAAGAAKGVWPRIPEKDKPEMAGGADIKRDRKSPFPERIRVVPYNNTMAGNNKCNLRNFVRLIREHGIPTVEQSHEPGWKGVTWRHIINIWTPLRVGMSRGVDPLKRAIAMLPGMWGYWISHQDASEARLRQIFDADGYTIDQQTFELALQHVLDYIEGH